MDNVEIKPLTYADIHAFYGRGLPQTCKGWAIYLNGDLAAICGITLGPGVMVGFSEIKPGLKVAKITIWRTAKKVMGLIEETGIHTFYAMASRTIPDAPAFLRRLGFQHIEHSARGEVFKYG